MVARTLLVFDSSCDDAVFHGCVLVHFLELIEIILPCHNLQLINDLFLLFFSIISPAVNAESVECRHQADSPDGEGVCHHLLLSGLS